MPKTIQTILERNNLRNSNLSNLEFYIFIFLEIFIILIYLEIIELNFCGFEKNLKKNIDSRAINEIIQIFPSRKSKLRDNSISSNI